MDRRESGVVKFFIPKEGWGFIESDSGDDVFVHYKHIQMNGYRQLTCGQRVFYDRKVGDRGAYAENVSELKRSRSR